MTQLTVKVMIPADLTKVWHCWTDPTHVTSWNFASADWCCPSAVNDLQAGGKFVYQMQAVDESMGFDFTGVYSQVIPNQLIAYQMEDQRQVSVTFTESAAGIEVVEVFEAETENSLELQQEGWQAILANFKAHVLACG